jgi:hypothetical protein
LAIIAATTAAAAATQPAMANEKAQSSMRISVRIPPLCSLTSSPIEVDAARAAASATFFESCNTNRGFQVIATHRQLGDSEGASVNYDGRNIALQPGGLSPVQFRQGARHGAVSVSVSGEELVAPLAVSFAMTPV